MSESRVERFVRLLKDKPVPKKPSNENDAPKADEGRALSDSDLERVTGGAGEDFGRGKM
jgi:hypothetical protein